MDNRFGLNLEIESKVNSLVGVNQKRTFIRELTFGIGAFRSRFDFCGLGFAGFDI